MLNNNFKSLKRDGLSILYKHLFKRQLLLGLIINLKCPFLLDQLPESVIGVQ